MLSRLAVALCSFCAVLVLAMPPALAELPRAAESPLAGLVFDDKPIALPLARNFQVAMTTVGKELQRSCGTIESYGWRLGAGEQQRANQIFASTVERLRGLGYAIQSQSPASVASDVTVFSAERKNKNLLFMWSAGELGLVLLVCDTQPGTGAIASPPTPTVIASSPVIVPMPEPMAKPPVVDPFPKFTPRGRWIGGYTCAQGYTGGTLTISSVSGEEISGTFRFYPTPRNQNVPKGSYRITGQYDRETKRILINPGAWIDHPKDFYNAIMIGRFDPARKIFSGLFQGVTGCTSFEARYTDANVAVEETAAKPKKKPVTKKKPKAETKPEVKAEEKPAETTPAVGETSPTVTAPAETVAVPTAPSDLPTPPAELAAPPVAPAAAPSAPVDVMTPSGDGIAVPGTTPAAPPEALPGSQAPAQ
jgi:hypothetical protein